MKLLLDTHVAIWALTLDARLKLDARTLIADSINIVFVSAVSIQEIAIKRALRRPGAPPYTAREAIDGFREVGFFMLDVSAAHAAAVEDLPLVHRDPFDRLLVAQALQEPLRLVTHDKTVARYSDTILYIG